MKRRLYLGLHTTRPCGCSNRREWWLFGHQHTPWTICASHIGQEIKAMFERNAEWIDRKDNNQ